MMKKLPQKNVGTPRGNGEGDGQLAHRKRPPVSSARRFNPRAPRADDQLRLKLETALKDLTSTPPKGHPKQQPQLKSASVAEITPTKSSAIKRRLATTASAEASFEIYATPRPLVATLEKRRCSQERHVCRVYKRLLLLAWRRTRAKRLDAETALAKQRMQINQLELQVDLLANLRTAESQKRDEALAESHQLKKELETVQADKLMLVEKTQYLNNCLEIAQNDLKTAQVENDFLSDQSLKLQETLGKQKAENRTLENKIQSLESDISNHKLTISNLQADLKNADQTKRTLEHNYKLREKKYAQLKCKFKKQLDANEAVTKQIRSLLDEKQDISSRVETLESQLNDYVRSCELLKVVNLELTQEVQEVMVELDEEKKRRWIKNTKQIALLSLAALQKVARAYFTAPVNF